MLRIQALCAAAGALLLATAAMAQNSDPTSTVIGTTGKKSQSLQYTLKAGDAGCVTYAFNNITFSPGFNYTAVLGLKDLPSGCDASKLRIIKQYTIGTCPETRANNYMVSSLNIKNDCTDPITYANTTTCKTVFASAPDEAYATEGITVGDVIDMGKVCWAPREVYYFVRNSCDQPVTVTIKVYTNQYNGACSNSNDTDDGGDDAGGPTSSGGGGGSSLSTGAKVGIAIGVIGGVIIIAAIVWFTCCQLRKQ